MVGKNRQQPEQGIAVDIVDIPGPPDGEGSADQICDPVCRNGPGFYAVHDLTEAGGIGPVVFRFIAEFFQGRGGDVQKPCLHGTGPDDTDGDAPEHELTAEGIGVFFQSGFGNGIDTRKGQRIQRRQFAGDDRDPAAGAHHRGEHPIHPVDAENIDLKDSPEPGIVDFRQRIQIVDSGGVDDGIQRFGDAPDLFRRLLQGSGICEIAGKIADAGDIALPQIQSQHLPAFFCQFSADGAAHAACGTGDQYSFHGKPLPFF